MSNFCRQQLQILCGGKKITPHQIAQLESTTTRSTALGDLRKAINLYLKRKEWLDDDFESEVCLLVIRGSELIASIEGKLLVAVEGYLHGNRPLEEVEAAVLNARRRLVPAKSNGSSKESSEIGDEDCIILLAVICIYFGIATESVPQPPIKVLQNLEKKLIDILEIPPTPFSDKHVHSILAEISTAPMQDYIHDLMIRLYPGSSLNFSPTKIQSHAKIPSLSKKLEFKQVEEALIKAKKILSKWEQAKQLELIVDALIYGNEYSKALEVTNLIRRASCKSNALATILEALNSKDDSQKKEIFKIAEQAVEEIPHQTKRVRFGGRGRERARHFVRLAHMQETSGNSKEARKLLSRALAGLMKVGESIYDQVDFSLLCTPLVDEPLQYLSYAVRKIEGVWNWGDQRRMFEWMSSCLKTLPLETNLQFYHLLENHLKSMEHSTAGRKDELSQLTYLEPRSCLHLTYHLAEAFISHKENETALRILDRLSVLSREYLQESLRPEFTAMLVNGYSQAQSIDEAINQADKIKNPRHLARALLSLKSCPYLPDDKRENLNKLLELTLPKCRTENSSAELQCLSKIIEQDSLNADGLWEYLRAVFNKSQTRVHVIWKLCASNLQTVKEWVAKEDRQLRDILQEELRNLDRASNSLLRKVCEALLKLSTWEQVCKYLSQMDMDHPETIQLMNHPRMAHALLEQYPEYDPLSDWLKQMEFGELTQRWIMRQWRRQVAIECLNPMEVIMDSFKNSDWLGGEWGVRCYLFSILRTKSTSYYQRLSNELSASLQFP